MAHIADTARLGIAEGLQTANLEASTLAQELEVQFAALPAAAWADRLRQAGVSTHALVPVAELMIDPWVRSHGLSVTQTVEGVGNVTMPGLSVRLSDTPMRLGDPPHRPGVRCRGHLARAGHGRGLAGPGAGVGAANLRLAVGLAWRQPVQAVET
jgi:crotonobetainyl-CoA:carnitine CoA-transferase CaiB-like acyl-CoA transferase